MGQNCSRVSGSLLNEVVLETSEAWPCGGVHSFAIIYPFSFCLISLTPGSHGRAWLGRREKQVISVEIGWLPLPYLAVQREYEMPSVQFSPILMRKGASPVLGRISLRAPEPLSQVCSVGTKH